MVEERSHNGAFRWFHFVGPKLQVLEQTVPYAKEIPEPP